MTELKVGEMLGNIELTGLLDSGGMGEIWIGFHKGLEAVVAVKIPIIRRQEIIHRMLTEARSQYKLRGDPYIVKIHDVKEEPEPHIVMEYVQAKDLESYLFRHNHELQDPNMQLRILELLYKVSKSLNRAHHFEEFGRKNPIIHRDIKPENILVIEHNTGMLEPRTIDWGLARIGANPEMTNDSSVMGSPLYISPEQFRDPERVDPKTDVWSMGLTIFHVVTGEIFYDDVILSGENADNKMVVVSKVNRWWDPEEGQEESARIRERLLQLPEWAYGIVEPCVRVNRDKRINMIQLIKKLEGAISYLKIEMRRTCGRVTAPVVCPPPQRTVLDEADTFQSPSMPAMMKQVEKGEREKPAKKGISLPFKLTMGLGLVLLVLGGWLLIKGSASKTTSKSKRKPHISFKSSATVVQDVKVPKLKKLQIKKKPLEPSKPLNGDSMPSDKYISKLYIQKNNWCHHNDPMRKYYKEARSHNSKCIRDQVVKLFRSGHRGTALILLNELKAHFCIWVYKKFNKDIVKECKNIESTRKRLMRSLSGRTLQAYDKRLRKRWPITQEIRKHEIQRVLSQWKRKRQKRQKPQR